MQTAIGAHRRGWWPNLHLTPACRYDGSGSAGWSRIRIGLPVLWFCRVAQAVVQADETVIHLIPQVLAPQRLRNRRRKTIYPASRIKIVSRLLSETCGGKTFLLRSCQYLE